MVWNTKTQIHSHNAENILQPETTSSTLTNECNFVSLLALERLIFLKYRHYANESVIYYYFLILYTHFMSPDPIYINYWKQCEA